jgi:hypothetical protein
MFAQGIAMQTAKAKQQSKPKHETGQAYGRQAADPYKLLGLATVALAIEEARRGDLESRRWLLSEGAAWLEGCGAGPVDSTWWAAWVKAGCPGKSKP